MFFCIKIKIIIIITIIFKGSKRVYERENVWCNNNINNNSKCGVQSGWSSVEGGLPDCAIRVCTVNSAEGGAEK